MIAAGTYRHRISLLRQIKTTDSLGQTQTIWQKELVNISATVEDLSGRALLAAQEVHSTVNVRIKLRFRPQIKAGMRVVFKDQGFTVQSVIRGDALNIELHLLCSTGLIDP